MGSHKWVRVARLCAAVVLVTIGMPLISTATFLTKCGDFAAVVIVLDGATQALCTVSSPSYGLPSVTVDTLSFDRGIGRFNIHGYPGGFDLVQGQLWTTIAAKPSRAITQVNIRENGDLLVDGEGTVITLVSVGVSATIRTSS